MRFCPRCGSGFPDETLRCTADGELLLEVSRDPLIGAAFNSYRIVERVGMGGMARVYRAVHAFLDRQYAVKIMHHDLAADPTFVKRFQREALAVSRIRHENVVQLFDFGVTPEGQIFLVMEWVSGRTLREVIDQEAPLGVERTARLMRQLASGLDEAHRQGFVHRDLKPANVMLTERTEREPAEKVKLLDFGLVRVLGDSPESQRITQQGQMIGTPYYMAPELIRSENATEQTDLYALGVVLYEMLAGRLPFRENEIGRLFKAHLEERPPQLFDCGGLEAIAMELLEKSPHLRTRSAQALLRSLDALGLLSRVAVAPRTDEPALERTEHDAHVPLAPSLALHAQDFDDTPGETTPPPADHTVPMPPVSRENRTDPTQLPDTLRRREAAPQMPDSNDHTVPTQLPPSNGIPPSEERTVDAASENAAELSELSALARAAAAAKEPASIPDTDPPPEIAPRSFSRPHPPARSSGWRADRPAREGRAPSGVREADLPGRQHAVPPNVTTGETVPPPARASGRHSAREGRAPSGVREADPPGRHPATAETGRGPLVPPATTGDTAPPAARTSARGAAIPSGATPETAGVKPALLETVEDFDPPLRPQETRTVEDLDLAAPGDRAHDSRTVEDFDFEPPPTPTAPARPASMAGVADTPRLEATTELDGSGEPAPEPPPKPPPRAPAKPKRHDDIAETVSRNAVGPLRASPNVVLYAALFLVVAIVFATTLLRKPEDTSGFVSVDPLPPPAPIPVVPTATVAETSTRTAALATRTPTASVFVGPPLPAALPEPPSKPRKPAKRPKKERPPKRPASKRRR